MRISDWSSDVCSSDLQAPPFAPPLYQAVNEEIKKQGKTIAYDAQPGVSQQNRPHKHWPVASSSHHDPKPRCASERRQLKRRQNITQLNTPETASEGGRYTSISRSAARAPLKNQHHLR